MKILFKNASILKMDDSPIFYGNLVTKDNRIEYIGSHPEKYGPFDREIDCQGNILMPGFKNAHAHCAMTFLRSKADDDTLHDWLFNVVFPREEQFIPEDIYHLTKVAFLEYIAGGITCCFDQYFYIPEVAKAADEMGFRVSLLGCSPFKDGSNDAAELYYKEIKSRVNSLVTVEFGLHAEYTASDQMLDSASEFVKEHKTPFYIHLSETKSEVEECIKNRGDTPAKVLDKYNLWDYGGAAFHCCYLSDEDVELFKKKNVAVITCPGSNLKLASGIAPIKKYLDAGLLVGIGTDGPASNNSLDMFKEMWLVSCLSKYVTGNVQAIDSYTILKMATVNGAKILNLNDADILEVGKLADFIELDMSKPSMQPINDVINNIVYSGSKDLVKRTVINGKVLYEEGKFNLDQSIEEIYDNARKTADRIEEAYLNNKNE